MFELKGTGRIMRDTAKRLGTGVIVSLLIPSMAFAQTPTPAAQPAPSAPADQAAPAPAPAPAAPPKPLSESLEGPAKAAYEAGKLLYGDGDFKGARVKFQAAFDASKDPRLLWNMAACEEKLRHYAKAVTDIDRYLTESGTQITDQDRAEAKQLHDTLQGFTAALTFKVNEPDADVSIDGEVVGKSPLAAPMVTDIGEHGILVHKDGFLDFTKTVQISGPLSIDVQLDKEKHEGRLDVKAPDGAEIKIDGQSVGVGSWSGTLPSGGHQLTVSASGMRTSQSEVVLQDSQTRSVDVALEPASDGTFGGLPGWAWAVTGVVVAGCAVGGYFLFRKQGTTNTGTPGTLDPGTVQLQFR
jgi:hypothetical protein